MKILEKIAAADDLHVPETDDRKARARRNGERVPSRHQGLGTMTLLALVHGGSVAYPRSEAIGGRPPMEPR